MRAGIDRQPGAAGKSLGGDSDAGTWRQASIAVDREGGAHALAFVGQIIDAPTVLCGPRRKGRQQC